LRNRRIFVAIFCLFSAFFFGKTQLKSKNIKYNKLPDVDAKNMSKHKNITIFNCQFLKKQVTSHFAAAKAPICDCSWLFVTIPGLVKPVADTRYYKNDSAVSEARSIWQTYGYHSWIKNLKRGSKHECGGAWETENQLFVALN